MCPQRLLSRAQHTSYMLRDGTGTIAIQLPFAVHLPNCLRAVHGARAEQSPLLRALGGAEGLASGTLFAPPKYRTTTAGETRTFTLNESSGRPRDGAEIVTALADFALPLDGRGVTAPNPSFPQPSWWTSAPVAHGVVLRTTDLLVRRVRAGSTTGRKRREREAGEEAGGRPSSRYVVEAVVSRLLSFSVPADVSFWEPLDATGSTQPAAGVTMMSPGSLRSPHQSRMSYRHAGDPSMHVTGPGVPVNVEVDLGPVGEPPIVPVAAVDPVTLAWRSANVTADFAQHFADALARRPVWLAGALEDDVVKRLSTGGTGGGSTSSRTLIHIAALCFTYTCRTGAFNRCRIAFGYDPRTTSESVRFQRLLWRFRPGLVRFLRQLYQRQGWVQEIAATLTASSLNDAATAFHVQMLLREKVSEQLQLDDCMVVLSPMLRAAIETRASTATFHPIHGWLTADLCRQILGELNDALTAYLAAKVVPLVDRTVDPQVVAVMLRGAVDTGALRPPTLPAVNGVASLPLPTLVATDSSRGSAERRFPDDDDGDDGRRRPTLQHDDDGGALASSVGDDDDDEEDEEGDDDDAVFSDNDWDH